jgi:hypothetical protein
MLYPMAKKKKSDIIELQTAHYFGLRDFKTKKAYAK